MREMTMELCGIYRIMLCFMMTKGRQNAESYLMLPHEKEVTLPLTIGPPFQPNLASVLIRFRTHKIGLIADIEKMLLQVKLAPEDRDVHRYLWGDLQPNEAPKVYRMQRLTLTQVLSLLLQQSTLM